MSNTSPSAPDSVASHHYFDRDVGHKAVKLLPSEYYVTTDDTVLSTVLGSCVAACLRDPVAGIPARPPSHARPTSTESCR